MNSFTPLVTVASLLLLTTSDAARLIPGVALWFEVECPPGWAEIASSHGRAILSDPFGNELGKTVVGTPLGLKEEPVSVVRKSSTWLRLVSEIALKLAIVSHPHSGLYVAYLWRGDEYGLRWGSFINDHDGLYEFVFCNEYERDSHG